MVERAMTWVLVQACWAVVIAQALGQLFLIGLVIWVLVTLLLGMGRLAWGVWS